MVHDTFPHDGRTLPRGALVVYREYYGMQPGKPNVGLKLPAEEAFLLRLAPTGSRIGASWRPSQILSDVN